MRPVPIPAVRGSCLAHILTYLAGDLPSTSPTPPRQDPGIQKSNEKNRKTDGSEQRLPCAITPSIFRIIRSAHGTAAAIMDSVIGAWASNQKVRPQSSDDAIPNIEWLWPAGRVAIQAIEVVTKGLVFRMAADVFLNKRTDCYDIQFVLAGIFQCRMS